ncbi:ParA family protein [Plastoroseomonas hellenica]|uniref:ParA family protein n=1 Tax=Plastoroseomonas hellenica TaxID=2687306 RepID=UPI001BA901D5|nr:AAA family ATPase [Plastoroseomonas hellenica]MBR0646858.1 ParA family protein [Plastoroseomonas hellenica]
MTVYFDDSLPKLTEIIAKEFGSQALLDGVALRDISGRLCFYLSTPLDEANGARLTEILIQKLGRYARLDRVVAGAADFGVRAALQSADIITVDVKGTPVRLIDRRLVGADWLRTPVVPTEGAPRLVFASLKGGVGRSTALAVVAAHAASRGHRILAVDLDMEAPGLGAMLLNGATTPLFGMIDALVERSLGPLDATFVRDLVGASTLSSRGRVDVIPAFGARSLANPADILSKIGRAYGEVVHEDGSIDTILDQVANIIRLAENASRYDLVLVDARAGLHEVAAAALVGLGAEIFCFGIDEPQTFQGYRALFSHMDRYARSDVAEKEWLSRVSLVQAKAPQDAELRSEFARKCRKMLVGEDVLSDEHPFQVPLPDGFSDVSWDETVTDDDLGLTESGSTTDVLSIMYDSNFANFEPLKKHDQASEAVYRKAFGALLDYVEEAVSRGIGSGVSRRGGAPH